MVNTLVGSLFVCKMLVLPMIPKNVVKTIDNIIRDYLWRGKKSKIAYNILQLSKNEGGLNLVNLQRKDTSLKATWPQILSEEREYAEIVYTLMRVTHLNQDIWRCTLMKYDIERMKIKEPFWRDVLISWNEYNFYHDFRIENQIIWRIAT